MNAANNWFGTTDQGKIREKLFDKNADPELAEIEFKPFLKEPVEWDKP